MLVKISGGLVIGLAVCFPFYLWFFGWVNPVATAIYLISAGLLRYIAGWLRKNSGFDWFLILLPIFLGLLVLALGVQAGLFYPIAINMGLLGVFYSSLSAPKNFIQYLAEKIENRSLDRIEVRYTRWITKIWCAVFIVNISISVLLVWFHRLDLWTIYNGAVSYFIMLALLLGERLLRNRIHRKMRSAETIEVT